MAQVLFESGSPAAQQRSVPQGYPTGTGALTEEVLEPVHTTLQRHRRSRLDYTTIKFADTQKHRRFRHTGILQKQMRFSSAAWRRRSSVRSLKGTKHRTAR